LGLERSFLTLAAILAAAAVPAVWRGRCWLAALLILASIGFAIWCQYRAKQSRVVESFFGELEVQANEVATVLTIDGLQQTAVPKRLAPGDALGYGYLLELATAMKPDIKSAMVIGLGGGLAPRVLVMHGIRCATVEIDPQVIEIARREFAFTGDVTVGDGRAVLARTSERYDLIFLDACTADRLPWHLFTLEAMRLVRDRLAPTGMLTIQFIGDDGPWSASLVRTVDAAFGPHRSMVLASAAASSPVGLRWLFVGRDATLRPPSDAKTHGRFARWRQIDLRASGWLLTDDHFPAELAWAETALQWRDLTARGR
jgi:spermidine synthase